MRKIKLILFLTIMLSNLCACNNDNSDTPINNSEDLFSQPLPIIKKNIYGKWEWYMSTGGVTGIIYPQNIYVEIMDSICTINSPNNEVETIPYIWKKLQTYAYDHEGEETYVMWNKELDNGIWFFTTLKGDTLNLIPYLNGSPYLQKTFTDTFIRTK
jgi:hypothetical protein